MFSVDAFRTEVHDMASHYGISKVRVTKKKKGYITAKVFGDHAIDTIQSLMNRVCNLTNCFNTVKTVKPNYVTFSISYGF